MKRFLTMGLVAFMPLAACVSEKPYQDEIIVDVFPNNLQFIGQWVEILPGGDGEHFALLPNYFINSVDTPGVHYTTWREDGDILYLASEEHGEIAYHVTFRPDGSMFLQIDDQDWGRVFRRDD